MNAAERLRLWIAAELDTATGDDPYAIVYRHARAWGDLSAEAVDAAIRETFTIADDDARRLAFLAWSYVDGRTRDGHTAIEARALLAWLREAGPCDREAASSAVQRLLTEGALVGFRPAKGAALVQLAPHAESEETIAAWAERVLAPPAEP